MLLYTVNKFIMREFIRKIILFIVGLFLLTIPILIIFIIYISSISHNYKISSDITTLFMGDSYKECAINDNIIPYCINTASSSESYYYTFFKLKILYANNPSIKKVYLGFSFHSLSSHNDNTLKSVFIVPKYFYLLPFKEKLFLIKSNKGQLPLLFKNILKQGWIILLDQDKSPYRGGFMNDFKQTKAVKISINKSLDFHYYTNRKINSYSSLNIYYLNKIVDFCKSNGIEVFLLNTPLHEYYYKNVPIEYIKKLNKIVFDNKYPYIDLSNFKLDDKGFSPDGCHVSFLGATETTLELARSNKLSQKYLTIIDGA